MTIYLRRGDSGTRGDGGKGDWIVSWQAFLAGEGHYEGDYSPNFGPRTEAATKAFQKAVHIAEDGIVGGDATKAACGLGFSPPWGAQVKYIGDDETTGYMDPTWPQPADLDDDGRADLVYLSESERKKLWGDPLKEVVDGKPVVNQDWYDENIRRVHVPQLKGMDCYGNPSSGNVYFHKRAAAQFLGAMQDCEDEGLLGDFTSFGGTYVFRFIRGSTTTLSNHAFGVAPDFNMKENGLGKQPALVGETGTLRRIARIFEKWGFFWGGWFRSRKDGMHFECVKAIDSTTLADMVAQLSEVEHIIPWVEEAA